MFLSPSSNDPLSVLISMTVTIWTEVIFYRCKCPRNKVTAIMLSPFMLIDGNPYAAPSGALVKVWRYAFTSMHDWLLFLFLFRQANTSFYAEMSFNLVGVGAAYIDAQRGISGAFGFPMQIWIARPNVWIWYLHKLQLCPSFIYACKLLEMAHSEQLNAHLHIYIRTY